MTKLDENSQTTDMNLNLAISKIVLQFSQEWNNLSQKEKDKIIELILNA